MLVNSIEFLVGSRIVFGLKNLKEPVDGGLDMRSRYQRLPRITSVFAAGIVCWDV